MRPSYKAARSVRSSGSSGGGGRSNDRDATFICERGGRAAGLEVLSLLEGREGWERREVLPLLEGREGREVLEIREVQEVLRGEGTYLPLADCNLAGRGLVLFAAECRHCLTGKVIEIGHAVRKRTAMHDGRVGLVAP